MSDIIFINSATPNAIVIGSGLDAPASTNEAQVYWGVSPKPTLTAADLSVLGNSETATSFEKAVAYNCTGGRYPYIAYPAVWGTPDAVTVGGLNCSDLVIRDVGDAGSGIILRTVRFGNLQNGSNIRVVWA